MHKDGINTGSDMPFVPLILPLEAVRHLPSIIGFEQFLPVLIANIVSKLSMLAIRILCRTLIVARTLLPQNFGHQVGQSLDPHFSHHTEAIQAFQDRELDLLRMPSTPVSSSN